MCCFWGFKKLNLGCFFLVVVIVVVAVVLVVVVVVVVVVVSGGSSSSSSSTCCCCCSSNNSSSSRRSSVDYFQASYHLRVAHLYVKTLYIIFKAGFLLYTEGRRVSTKGLDRMSTQSSNQS